MTIQTIAIGALLMGLAAYGYTNAELNDKGEKPLTALIPGVFGAILVLCALIALVKPTLRKHVMHLAALVGLLGVAGGFMPIYRQTVKLGKPFDPTAPSVMSGIIFSLLCLIFLVLCVRSFIAARKARTAG